MRLHIFFSCLFLSLVKFKKVAILFECMNIFLNYTKKKGLPLWSISLNDCCPKESEVDDTSEFWQIGWFDALHSTLWSGLPQTWFKRQTGNSSSSSSGKRQTVIAIQNDSPCNASVLFELLSFLCPEFPKTEYRQNWNGWLLCTFFRRAMIAPSVFLLDLSKAIRMLRYFSSLSLS